jgi:hypothetical protein
MLPHLLALCNPTASSIAVVDPFAEEAMVFALDTTDVDYATVLAALPSPVVLGSVAANTNIAMVRSIVTQSALDADGDLAALATNVPSAACRGKFIKNSQFHTFGWHMLGQPEDSTRAIAGEAIVWLGSAPRGAADGSTPYDCVGTYRDYKEDVSTLWLPGTVYVIQGFQSGDRTDEPGANGFPKNTCPKFQNCAGDPCTWRMDYIPQPGMLWCGWRNIQGTNNEFTRPDAGSFPRVWTATGPSDGQWLGPIDMTLSDEDVYANHCFKTVASQSEVEAEAMTRWWSGTALWVHMPDDTDPTDRVYTETFLGWTPGTMYYRTPGLAGYEDLEFINCQLIGGGGACMSFNADSQFVENFPKAKFLGGRYLAGVSFKPKDKCIAGTEWGWSTDGDIVFDTSDRPDPDTDPYIQDVINEHGSDPAGWANMPRFVEVNSSFEGIYWFGTGPKSDDGIIQGYLARHIGTADPILLAKKGTAQFDDRDSHALAWQGASNWNVSFMYLQNAGLACNNYINDDALSSQNSVGMIVTDFVIRDSHQKFSESTGGAGQGGINIGEDGAGPRTDGTGIKTGCEMRRGCIYNIIGDPTQAFGSAPARVTDGVAMAFSIEQSAIYDHITVWACTNAHIGGHVSVDSTYTRFPDYIGMQSTVTNCIYREIEQLIFWTRDSLFFSASPAATGYYIGQGNQVILKSTENTSTTKKWRMGGTEITWAQWQAQAKASPPGDAVSDFDTTSSIELAP